MALTVNLTFFRIEMGNCCDFLKKSEDDEEEEGDYDFVPSPNHYDGKRNWKEQRHGYGTYYYDNGDVYEGHWENDEKHGEGTYLFASGKVLKGFFERDSYIGSVRLSPKKGKKHKKDKVEQCPAKKIYMDDDGLIVAEARMQNKPSPYPPKDAFKDLGRPDIDTSLLERQKKEKQARERQQRHKKTTERIRKKYNIPIPK
ncbi:MORN repeat-containing protein 3-like [Clytia hemisphaerica]|uniref:Uncharacterized protein n=1 Tax=Clytia hemisphaerica TaxID=252671 RepID=A0A7M5WJA2_9CNID